MIRTSLFFIFFLCTRMVFAQSSGSRRRGNGNKAPAKNRGVDALPVETKGGATKPGTCHPDFTNTK